MTDINQQMFSHKMLTCISGWNPRDCPRQRYWDILPYFSKKSHCYFEMTNFYHWNLIRICAILELVWNSPIVLQVQAYPWNPGGNLNKMPSYKHRNSHYKDKTYHNHLIFIMGIQIPGKMVLILKQGPGAVTEAAYRGFSAAMMGAQCFI